MVARKFIAEGQRHEALVYIGDAPKGGNNNRRVFARCDCGKITNIEMQHFAEAKSCGCIRTKHGHSSDGLSSRTYLAWRGAKERCLNPKNKDYMNYGGRGIKVCARWLDSFSNFLSDMGEAPDGMTIDRFPDQNGDYGPGNCRWASLRDQQNNRRNTVFLEYKGIKKSISEWATDFGINLDALYRRVHVHKMSVEAALETPCIKRKPRSLKKS